MNEDFIMKVLPVFQGLQVYHRHRVFGLQFLPRRGPAIICSTHSLATYDLMMLMAAVYKVDGRFPRSLIDRTFYRFPGLGRFMEQLGCVVGNIDNARSILSNGELLYIAPGGMEESLRSSRNKYQFYWKKRRGFSRLSLETGAPIVLAACPGADDIFKVYDSPLTKWAYNKMRLPLFIARGIGPTPIPRPVRVEHFLSEPIYPPKKNPDPEAFERQVYRYHRKIIKQMEALMERVAHPREDLQLTDGKEPT